MEIEVQRKSAPIRVLVVDDHPAVRHGLKALFDLEGIAVCAEAGNSAEALAGAEKHRPDMALVDLALGDEDGTTLIADLVKRALPSLAYSIHEDERHVRKALAAGARGYVTKREAHRVLIQAILEVVGGHRFLSPRAAMNLAEQSMDCSRHGQPQPDGHESFGFDKNDRFGITEE